MQEEKQYSYLYEDEDEEISWKTVFGGAALTFFIAWAILRMSPGVC